MKQVLVEKLRPGDCIQTADEVARVVDVPAKCYAGHRIYVLVPVERSRAVVEQRYAPGDFVPLATSLKGAADALAMFVGLVAVALTLLVVCAAIAGALTGP